MKQHGFFDENDRLKELSKIGDPLERLNTYINWEQFRGILVKTLQKEPKGPGGRPPFDYVMMFKILILQRLYNQCQQLKRSEENATFCEMKDQIHFRGSSMKRKPVFRKILEKLNTLIHTKGTVRKARTKRTYFTRNRKMTFPEIVLLILAKINTGTQTALNRYLKTYSERAERMSQQAFGKAGSHFDYTPFEAMFRETTSEPP